MGLFKFGGFIVVFYGLNSLIVIINSVRFLLKRKGLLSIKRSFFSYLLYHG